MTGCNDNTEDPIEQVENLCVAIQRAVQEADWTAAGTLLASRHALLEQIFASAPRSAAAAERLRGLVGRITQLDQELQGIAAAARDDAAEQIRALRAGRRAAEAYQGNAG